MTKHLANDRFVSEKALLSSTGQRRFPAYELVVGDTTVARLGRFGWWRIYFGRGQRIELADGTSWRLRAIDSADAICPVIVNTENKKVALAAPFHGVYGLNGADWSYVLYPAKKRGFTRPNHWILRHHEDDVAVVSNSPTGVEASEPVPLGAVFLSFVLTRYAIPGESGLGVPPMRWGKF